MKLLGLPFDVHNNTLWIGRRDVAQEVGFSLFGECNLRCDFCCDAYRHNNNASIEKIEACLKHYKEVLPTIPRHYINVKLLGGELFQDKFDQSIFDAYDSFIGTLIEETNRCGKEIQLSTSSNLVFHKRERVLELLQKYNIRLLASFDLVGRFRHQRQVEMFLDNSKYFSSNGINFAVAFVATNGNIQSIYNKTNLFKEWEELYNLYPMQFTYYNDVGIESYTVYEKDLYDFFCFCLKNYPNIGNVQSLLDEYEGKVLPNSYCTGEIWINESLIYHCCDLKQASINLLKNKECLICEYSDRCSGTCNRLFNESNFCHKKAFFEYLESSQYVR